MKITQIADALNKVINKLQIGDTVSGETYTETIQADLSNIVDVGKTVLEFTGASADNRDSFVKSLIDQVGKVIFVDRTYTSQAPNILKEGWEYGSILQKVRCKLQDARDNATWDLFNYPVEGGASYPDPFELSPPNVSATFYNSKTTYEVPITLADYQLREAFRGASEMSRFFAMIENRIRMKRTLCNDGLIMNTIAHLIASKISGGNDKCVINLLALYNDGSSSAIATPEAAMRNPDFLRFASNTIMKYKKYIAAASDQYNEGDYVTFTTPDRLKFIAVTDFAKDMETYLYSGTYHDEFVKMEGYEEVAFWQDASNRTKIDTFIDNDGSVDRVTNDYVVAVMFDDEAAAVCNENDRVTSIYNPRGEYTNYFYKWDALYMNDLFENCIVFTLSDDGGRNRIPSDEIVIGANATAGTDVKVTIPAGETGVTAKAKLNSEDLTGTLNVGEAVPAGWDALTSGTAKTYASAAVGDYVNIIKIKSNKIYQIYSYKLTESDVK